EEHRGNEYRDTNARQQDRSPRASLAPARKIGRPEAAGARSSIHPLALTVVRLYPCTEPDLKVDYLATSIEDNPDLLTGRKREQRVPKRMAVIDHEILDRGDDVAGTDSGLRGRPASGHGSD